MARWRPWALSRRKKGGKSTNVPPPGHRGVQLAFAAEDPAPGDQAVNGSGLLALSNSRDASLIIWPSCLCCRHSDAGPRE